MPVVFGLLNVNKPPGMSSYDVIRRVRRCVGRKLKVGHAGTLDPLAEGVLVVCLGPATRLVPLIQAGEKEYAVDAELGAFTSTDDREGERRGVPDAPVPTAGAVAEAVARFVGTIQQTPPAYSAVKVAGRRAYEIARRGAAPEIAPRAVTVHGIEVQGYDWPVLRLRVVCGSGTYVRSLVRDIGEALGTGGYCLRIVRTRVGAFAAADACRIDDLQPEGIGALLIDPLAAVPAGARVAVDAAALRAFAHGQAAPAAAPPGGADLLAAVGPGGELAALVRFDRAAGVLRPVKVFVGSR